MSVSHSVEGSSYAAAQTNAGQASKSALAEEIKKAEEFRKVLKKLDAELGTPAERARKKEEEKKAEEAKESKQKRINDLYAKIAQLRGMLSAKGGSDPGIEAQIAAIQTELFWLMFSF